MSAHSAPPMSTHGQRRRLEATISRDGGVAVLTLSDGLNNVLTAEAFATIQQTLADRISDPTVTAIVICSSARAFSVGADLSSGPSALADLVEQDGGRAVDWLEPAGRVTALMRSSRVPVVAAIAGDAIGGGATMSLGADVRLAAPTARFGFPFGRVGVVPEGGCTWLLPRLVGLSRATDWLVSGRLIHAEEAHAAGLVSELRSLEELLPRAIEVARTLGEATSPLARRRILDLLDEGMTRTFDSSRRIESHAMREAALSDDVQEGIRAFIERRSPHFPSVTAEVIVDGL
jgi:enoyl-CoA hydratase/carnithine racemase